MKHFSPEPERPMREPRHARLFALHQQLLRCDQNASTGADDATVTVDFAQAFLKDAALSLTPLRKRR